MGGAERLVIDQIHECMRRNIHVHLLTIKSESPHSLSSQCRLSNQYIHHVRVRSIYDVQSWYQIYSCIKKVNPDVVMTHLWFSNTIGRVCAWLAGIRRIISFEHNIYDMVKNKKMFFTDRILQHLSTYIIAVSESVKDSLVTHGIDEEKIIVLLNGIDIQRFVSPPDTSRELFGYTQSDFVFVCVARLIHQKGIDILIHALSFVPQAKLVLVGQGSDQRKLEKLATDTCVQDRVCFLGTHSDIPTLLALSDCFVLPSRYEGLGIVVLEAMAARLPIIISDFEAGRHMIENGTHGLVVPREDISALAQAMNIMKNNRAFRVSCSTQAVKRVQQFSIASYMDLLLKYL